MRAVSRARLNKALVLMTDTDRATTIERLAWALIVLTAVVGVYFARAIGRGEFVELVFGSKQPILGPLVGLVIYGSSAIVMGSDFTQGQSRPLPVAWGFAVGVAGCLLCLAILLNRILHMLYPSLI